MTDDMSWIKRGDKVGAVEAAVVVCHQTSTEPGGRRRPNAAPRTAFLLVLVCVPECKHVQYILLIYL